MNMKQKNIKTASAISQGSGVGLVSHYQFENGSSQFVFFDVQNGSGSSIDKSLSFFTETFVQTLASSNGLILLSGYSGDQPCYFVFNPLTKSSTIVPQPCVNGRVVRVGLAFDGCQYEVVAVEANSSGSSDGLGLHVFSSDTSKWRSHHPTNLTLPSMPEIEFQELGTPPLYSNGAIHWEIGGYLLEYQVQGNHCELYELPNVFEDWSWQSTMTYRRCLCESGGRIYYCYADFDGFHIWDFLKKHEYDNFGFYPYIDSRKFRWKLVHSIMHEVFISKYQNIYGSYSDWEPYKIAPIAYSEVAQTIYLLLPGTVVSYNFDTGILRSICTYSYPCINFNCCSFLPWKRGTDLQANGETELNLPLAEMEKLSL
ncbi:hypothetical protein RIF29_04570 [Crotalaria pallida]|uniref:F-box protein At3g26010-like beta-propeller domain-containing protein n=1 Tax=Crotalaria pallida TaxID=3830 RepID=A0AAN9P9W6_CROPI